MKKILVATDFTKYAHYALRSAASIAEQTGAQMILLHVIDRPIDLGDESYENYHNMPGDKSVIINIKDQLNSLLKKHKIKNAKIFYELRFDVFRTILEQSNIHQVDLIVMGAYGSSGSEDSFVGSNTRRVIQKAKMPVLIVKENFKNFKIANSVLASEFYGEIYQVFPKMKEVMDLFDTNLHLLKVNTPNQFQRSQETLKLMTDFGSEFSLKNYSTNVYNDLTVEDGIINFSKSLGADLIAITPDGLWRIAQVLSKSLTDRLMKKSVKAILSMKTRQTVLTAGEMLYMEEYNKFSSERIQP